MSEKRILSRIAALCLFCLLVIHSGAQVRLPEIFSDHMVLQQQEDVAIWGWADPQEEIKIIGTWSADTVILKTPNHGRWSGKIKTPEAGGPFQLRINGRDNVVVLEDVLIGEVWVCSGQSNMEWSVMNGIDNGEQVAARAKHDKIRFFDIPKTTSISPQDRVDASWAACTPETMRRFSAVGYFFGSHLLENLEVPIGLINSSWGGTNAETWTPQEVIEEDPDFARWEQVFEPVDYWPLAPGYAFNAMIHPLIPYNLAGVIWYQGESNRVNASTYKRLFPVMIESWRSYWSEDFPFYYVQIAPFNYAEPLLGALVREAQLQTLATKHTGMVVVNDIGNLYDIHPRNKLDVGERLAKWALRYQYGDRSVSPSGPLYRSYEVEGSTVKIYFSYNDGLNFRGNPEQYFRIAGQDGVFLPAEEVKIIDNHLELSHSQIPEPASVRYAFENLGEGNLFNQANLPASSFRTDEWPINLTLPIINTARMAQGMEITMIAPDQSTIYYTLDGSMPSTESQPYSEPFAIDRNVTIRATCVKNGRVADVVATEEVLFNKATFKSVDLFSAYDDQYSASGTATLTDGKLGSMNFNDRRWLGFEGEDIELIIDLGEVVDIQSIEARFLQEHSSWIFAPSSVVFEVSKNGKRFKEVHDQTFFNHEGEKNQIQSAKKLFRRVSGQYVKITARNQPCPGWHPATGEPGWLFMDEVIVE